jgi:hypothetical protein
MSRARALEWCRRFSDRRDEAEFGVRLEYPTTSKSDEDVREVGSVVRTDGHLSIRAKKNLISAERDCTVDFHANFRDEGSSCEDGVQEPHTKRFLSKISWRKKKDLGPGTSCSHQILLRVTPSSIR